MPGGNVDPAPGCTLIFGAGVGVDGGALVNSLVVFASPGCTSILGAEVGITDGTLVESSAACVALSGAVDGVDDGALVCAPFGSKSSSSLSDSGAR